MKKLYYNLNSSKHVNHPHDMKLVPRAHTIGKVSENSTLRWSRDIIEPLQENFENDRALSYFE